MEARRRTSSSPRSTRHVDPGRIRVAHLSCHIVRCQGDRGNGERPRPCGRCARAHCHLHQLRCGRSAISTGFRWGCGEWRPPTVHHPTTSGRHSTSSTTTATVTAPATVAVIQCVAGN
eukprot:5440024-Prymnesium_polylepis.1